MNGKIKFLVTIDLDTDKTTVKKLVPPKRDARGRFTGKHRKHRLSIGIPICKFAGLCPYAELMGAPRSRCEVM